MYKSTFQLITLVSKIITKHQRREKKVLINFVTSTMKVYKVPCVFEKLCQFLPQNVECHLQYKNGDHQLVKY